MLCEICGKNEATVHLTEIVDNKINKLHLCEECARKKGEEMEEHFGLSDLLAGLADFGTKAEPQREVKLKCEKCGMTYEDFKKTGRLGCGNCYDAFEENLSPLLKRIHGAARHLGKAPLKISKPSKPAAKKKKAETPDELRAQLQEAIKVEAFEEAAKLRDRIRELEKNQ